MSADGQGNSLRLPDFLIIGAMKSGTTTVYRDLARQPGIFLPQEKEPNSLLSDTVLKPVGRRDYASLFAGAPDGACCGEASTGYTKLPDNTGVPERAQQVLGNELKLIYLMREPVSRAVSHFHHCKAVGLDASPIDEALQRPGPYIDYGRYVMQLDAWLNVYPEHCLRTVFFEDYMAHRHENVTALHAFLGAQGETRPIDSASRFNKSAGRPVLKGGWRTIANNRLYRATLQRWLPWQWRQRIARTVLPRGPANLEWPTAETVENLLEWFAKDNEALQNRFGALPAAWDPQNITEIFARKRAGHT